MAGATSIAAREQLTAFSGAYREAAAAAGGEVERRFRIGGYAVAIRFAGPALEPYLTPALNHLAEEFAGEPDFTIHAWDSKTTGVHLPDAVYPLERHAENGMPGALAEDGVLSAYLRPDSGLSMFDTASDEAFYWLPNALAVPFEDRSNTFRGILNWWMSLHGRQFVHAAAVGVGADGVLLTGQGGSGKSTTALACVAAGMRFAADDYCLLEQGAPPTVHSLYNAAKSHPHNGDRLPRAASWIASAGWMAYGKAVFFGADQFPGQLAASLRVRAILAPRIVEAGEPSLYRLRPFAALASLAPSTLLQLSATLPAALRNMAHIAGSIPAYELRLPADPMLAPVVIRALLDEITDGND